LQHDEGNASEIFQLSKTLALHTSPFNRQHAKMDEVELAEGFEKGRAV